MHTHTQRHSSTLTHTQSFTEIHTHTCTSTSTHLHAHTYVHTHANTGAPFKHPLQAATLHTHTTIHTRTRSHIRTHIHTHTYTHVNTHTQKHTQARRLNIRYKPQPVKTVEGADTAVSGAEETSTSSSVAQVRHCFAGARIEFRSLACRVREGWCNQSCARLLQMAFRHPLCACQKPTAP